MDSFVSCSNGGRRKLPLPDLSLVDNYSPKSVNSSIVKPRYNTDLIAFNDNDDDDDDSEQHHYPRHLLPQSRESAQHEQAHVNNRTPVILRSCTKGCDTLDELLSHSGNSRRKTPGGQTFSLSSSTNNNNYLSASVENLCRTRDIDRRNFNEADLINHSYMQQMFETVSKIDRGSFSHVYDVLSRNDGQRYAIKIVGLAVKHRPIGRYHEINVFESVPAHDNLIKFVSAWREQDMIHIQTELCMLNFSRIAHYYYEYLDQKELTVYLLHCCAGLRHLHSLGFIHMDVKSDNILLGFDGRYKLADFGLVQSLTPSSSCGGGEDTFTEGDSRYLASEVLSFVYSEKADIFSLGMTLVEVIASINLPSDGTLWNAIRNFEDNSLDLPAPFNQVVMPGGKKHLCGGNEQKLNRYSVNFIQLILLMISKNHASRPTAQELIQMQAGVVGSVDALSNLMPIIENTKKSSYWKQVSHKNKRVFASSTPSLAKSDRAPPPPPLAPQSQQQVRNFSRSNFGSVQKTTRIRHVRNMSASFNKNNDGNRN